MLYFNGRRVAIGENLEPVVLLESAQPGDKITVAIKLLHTVDIKTFHGASLTIDFPADRPNPEDLARSFFPPRCWSLRLRLTTRLIWIR